MSHTIKRVLSALVIIISITAVIIIAFSNPEMKNAWKALASMDLKWVLGLFLCWAAYAGFEGCGTWSYLRSKGYKINLGRVIGVALIGFYYSNITPSAAGGQRKGPGWRSRCCSPPRAASAAGCAAGRSAARPPGP